MASPPPPPGAPPGSQPLPPNFFDPKPWQNNRSAIFAICIPLLSMCWFTTVARLGTRFFVSKNPGWDDLFVVMTLLMVTLCTTAFFVSTNYGMGNHIYLLDPSTIEKMFICHYIIGASYTNATACIKISLLLQYLRVLRRGTFTYRFTQFMLVFLGLWGFTWAFLCWGICLPDPSAFWKGTGKGCYATGSSNPSIVVKTIEAHSGVNVVQDLIVLSIPIRFLFLEDAPIGRKSMIALLSMGLLTCIFSVWRLQAIVVTSVGVNGGDLTWQEPQPFLISLAEVYVASLCASIPFFWPIIAQQLNKIMVMYEFNVSSEPRYRDDEIELTPARSKSETSGSLKEPTSEARHYADDFTQQQVNPFSEGLRVETIAQGGAPPKKKGGFVRFDHEI